MKLKKLNLLLLILILLLDRNLAASDKKAEETLGKFKKNFSLALKTAYKAEPNNSSRLFNFSLDLKNNQESNPGFITDPEEWSRLSLIKPKTTRAFLEMAALMTYSQARYWIKYSRFIEDWQYELKWKDQKRRFFTTEALRFDSNAFYLNWTHAFAGMLYYEFGRSNHLPWYKSLLFSTLGSLYWEYIVEWREIISINDNIMTGLGGYVLGESWFQMGRYFLNTPNPVGRFLSWLNPYLKINGYFDRHHPLPPYTHNFNSAAQDVYLFVGYRNSPTSSISQNTGNLAVSLHSRLITEPVYGLPGKVEENFTEPFYSQLDFDFMFHGESREEMGASAKVVPLGRFIQKISEEGQGYSLYYGLGSTFYLYVKRPLTEYDAGHLPVNKPEEFHFEEPRNFRDKLAAVNFLGPVADVMFYRRSWKFHLRAEAYPSFGMINAWAFNKYSVDHDVLGMKSTLTYYGYYYGFGPSFEALGEIRFKSLRLQASTLYHHYRSAQGRDRFQSWITDDSVVYDSRWHHGLNLEFKIPKTNVSVLASSQWVRRWGKVHEVEDRGLEKRYYLGLKYHL
jgi:hypothetical protein